MPARKSDARKSDASQPAGGIPSSNSNARFALKDDYQDSDSSHAPHPASTSAPAPAPQPAVSAASGLTSTSKKTSPPLAKMSHPTAAAMQQQQQQQPPQGDETEDEQHQDKKHAEVSSATTIEDLTLPKSIITRLAKGVLPANTQIQANAVLAMSKSTTVFVNYLASSANDHTVNQGKKTISPADVFKALDDIEFGFLKERLEAEYNKFNQIQTEKRTSYRAKVKAAKSGPTDASGNPSAAGEDISMADATSASAGVAGAADTSVEGAAAADDAHRSKKARVDPNATVSTVEHDDAETEDEDHQNGEDENEQDDEDDAEEDEEEGGESEEEGMVEDGLEEKVRQEERDEALDGDDSD